MTKEDQASTLCIAQIESFIMAQQQTPVPAIVFFFLNTSVPSGFVLVKQCSSCFPSLAIGKAVTEVQYLNNTLVLHYPSSSVVVMCAGPHFDSLTAYVSQTTLIPADICCFIRFIGCSPFSFSRICFSMSVRMLCRCIILG